MRSVLLFSVAIYGGVCLSSHASAQDQQTLPDAAQSFIVVGAAGLPEFEGADSLRPVPLIVSRLSVLGVDVELEGLESRIDVLPHPVWRAGPAIGVILPRDEGFVDDVQIGQLPDIDIALEVGGYVGFRSPFGSLEEGTLSGAVTVRHDVLGAHGGLTVDAEIEYFFAANRMLRFGFGANTSFATDDYFETYFSVDAADAALVGVSAFEAGGGVRDVGVEMFSILAFSPRWGVFGRVAYNRLLGDAANSPIAGEIGSPNQIFAGAGLFWSF